MTLVLTTTDPEVVSRLDVPVLELVNGQLGSARRA